MLQAETKITTLIVDSMVTRLNELAKHVSIVMIIYFLRYILVVTDHCVINLDDDNKITWRIHVDIAVQL